MTPNPSESSDETKLFYDMMLQLTHQTAETLLQRVEEVRRRFAQFEAAGCRKMRVLIVEDNRDQADSLMTVLRAWDFDPAVAYDAFSALEMANRNHPDAILADIGLPGMDGYELAQRVVAQPDLRDVVLAAVTAYNDGESRERSREVGFAQHFGKPTDLVQLHRFLDDRREALLRGEPESGS